MNFLIRSLRPLENALDLLPSKRIFFLENIIIFTKIFIRLSRILKSFLSLLQGMVKGNIDVERYELEEKTSFIKQIHQDNTILNFEGKNVLLM